MLHERGPSFSPLLVFELPLSARNVETKRTKNDGGCSEDDVDRHDVRPSRRIPSFFSMDSIEQTDRLSGCSDMAEEVARSDEE